MIRMMLVAVLALSAVPALASDTEQDAHAAAIPSSTDEARALAGKQAKAQEKAEIAHEVAQSCTCAPAK